jgi:hypothetical protein
VNLSRLRPPPALAILLVAGVGARLWLMLDYRPAYLSSNDSARFLHFAHRSDGLFEDTFGPSGYAAFLKVTRALWNQLEFTVAVQHLLGVAAALLLYAAVRRLGAPVWAAAIPAGVVLLSGDQLYVEHSLLSETVFLPLVAGGLYAAVRGLDEERRVPWLALAGALFAGAALFRNVGLVLPVVLAGWAAVVASGRIRERVVAVAACAAPAAAVLGVYAALAALSDGNTGITATSGWNAYGRAAPFADCDEFDPPPGTEDLCEDTPPDQRNGSLFYLWFTGSPARAKYGHPPLHQEELGKWGRRAILAQPVDYVKTVLADLPRFADPRLHKKRFSGGGWFLMSRRSSVAEQHVLFQLRRDYDFADPHRGHSAQVVSDWQKAARLGGVVPALMVVLALAGGFAARGRVRHGLVLFALAGGGLVVMPAATLTLIGRYAIPPTPIVAAAAGVGAWALVERARAIRARRDSSGRPASASA